MKIHRHTIKGHRRDHAAPALSGVGNGKLCIVLEVSQDFLKQAQGGAEL
jgi:hypothetical protein